MMNRGQTARLVSIRGVTGENEGLAPLSVKANVAWNLTGNVIYAGCQWGMLVMLAKLGSPEMVGLFALGLAVTAPVIMFTNLHLMAVQRTDTSRQYLFGDYFGLRLITTVIALLVIAGVVVVAGYRGEQAEVILVIGLAKAVESISNVVHGFLQQHERMDRIAISATIKGLLSLVALSGGVLLTGSILGGVVALLGAWVLTLFGYDLRSGRDIAMAVAVRSSAPGEPSVSVGLRPRWVSGKLRPLARLAFPLGIATLLTSLTVNVPRYFIEGQLGARELGIFAAMAYLMVTADTLSLALGQAASPRLATLYALDDRARFRALLLGLVGVGTVGSILGIVVAAIASRQILAVLYTPAYGAHAGIFVWLMVAVGIQFVASILTYGITAALYYRVQAPLAGAGLLAMFVACAALIPRYGLGGAAAAMIIAAMVNVGGTAAVMLHALVKETASGESEEPARLDDQRGRLMTGGVHVR